MTIKTKTAVKLLRCRMSEAQLTTCAYYVDLIGDPHGASQGPGNVIRRRRQLKCQWPSRLVYHWKLHFVLIRVTHTLMLSYRLYYKT